MTLNKAVYGEKTILLATELAIYPSESWEQQDNKRVNEIGVKQQVVESGSCWYVSNAEFPRSRNGGGFLVQGR